LPVTKHQAAEDLHRWLAAEVLNERA
jgi:hypothetical protein